MISDTANYFELELVLDYLTLFILHSIRGNLCFEKLIVSLRFKLWIFQLKVASHSTIYPKNWQLFTGTGGNFPQEWVAGLLWNLHTC
ncbi:hypothetical protein IBX65_07380 [Candidatus Aerophobetes bacterium]|nr:hypothetical protein [Candidatus Aerophobetes bacterium]